MEFEPKTAKWTTLEEDTLIDLVCDREEILFGSLKGPSGISTSKTRVGLWEQISQTVASCSTSGRREIKALKKKYFNVKQRSKEKIDERKRNLHRTGGGPAAPALTPAEQKLVERMEGRPVMVGLDGGIDTDSHDAAESGEPTETISSAQPSTSDLSTSSAQPSTSSAQSSKGKSAGKKNLKRRIEEENLLNIQLDSERIRADLLLTKEKHCLLQSQRWAFDSMRVYYETKLEVKYDVHLRHED